MPFESRLASGLVDRLPGLAADLVGRKPTIIATQTLPANAEADTRDHRTKIEFDRLKMRFDPLSVRFL